MNIFKMIKNNIEIKKLREEELWLDGFFMNRSETIACLGNEDEEGVEEMEDRFNFVTNRIDELEEANKVKFFR